MKRLALAACVAVLGITGCGGSTKHTCEEIEWRGSTCERLDHQELDHTMRQLGRQLRDR